MSANTRGLVFTRRLASLVLASLLVPSAFGRALFAERNFFGRVRVTRDAAGAAHLVVHGSTIHGMQHVREMDRCAPISYYHPSGPAGRFLRALGPAPAPRHVALIGLGSGALTCYARPGESWDLYELTPVMARVAADPRLFSFLRHSPAGATRLVLGDARLAIARARGRPYDLIIVDAFSSDAVPIHLITREALATYAGRLAPGGALLFHVSNRFFHLRPVLGTVAPLVGFRAFDFDDRAVTPAELAAGKQPSEWVLLARGDAAAPSAAWVPVPPAAMRVWTDDYSNPLGALTLPAPRAAGAPGPGGAEARTRGVGTPAEPP